MGTLDDPSISFLRRSLGSSTHEESSQQFLIVRIAGFGSSVGWQSLRDLLNDIEDGGEYVGS